jgi:hypothetical protein
VADIDTGRQAMAGQKIEFQGKTYTIQKVNPKNFVIFDEAGQTYKLNRMSRYKIVGEQTYAESRPDFSAFVAGTVVRVKPEAAARYSKFYYGSEQAFVVMKHNFNLVNVVKLGGDGGLYWRMLPGDLEIVKVD